ncbi:MAG: glycosyltransferase 87 family protein [Chloroflexota bacterium]
MGTGGRLRRYLPLLLFAAAHALIFRFLLGSGNSVFSDRASDIFNGLLPYRDFVLEYPPLSLAVLLPPRLFAQDFWGYGRAFSYEMLLLDLAVLVLIYLLALRLGRSPWLALAVYTAVLLSTGSLAAQRYDLFPAALVLLAVYCLSRGKHTWCWAALALGTTAKLYPLLLVPLLGIYQVSRRDYKGLVKGVAAFLIITTGIMLPWVLLSPGGFWESFQFQLVRGLQIESTYASGLLVAENLGSTSLGVEFRHGGIDLVSPSADILARCSTWAMLAALAAVYLLYARSRRRCAGTTQETASQGSQEWNGMLVYFPLAIAAFLLTSKVLSPQFLLWLTPLVPLIGGRGRWWLWLLFIGIGGLTQYIFPHSYYDLMDLKPNAVAALTARNALLVLFTCLLVRRAARTMPQLPSSVKGEGY